MNKQAIHFKTTKKYTKEVIKKILEIEEKEGLTPSNVIYAAKDKNSVLHDFFDWNDTTAAHKYRLTQARDLINDIKIEVKDKEYFAFENVRVSVEDEAERVYKPVYDIVNNEDLKIQLIHRALRQLEYWELQNSRFKELSPIIKSAQKVRKEFNKKWQKKK